MDINLNNYEIVIYQTKANICRSNIERVGSFRWPSRVVFGVGSEPVGFKNANVNILSSPVNDLVIRSGTTVVFTESTQTVSPKKLQHLPTTESPNIEPLYIYCVYSELPLIVVVVVFSEFQDSLISCLKIKLVHFVY